METSLQKDPQYQIYSTTFFDYFQNRKGLDETELYLLNRYLTDTSKTVLEAGTGNGRLSFYIEKMGFRKINAFDFVPEMIGLDVRKAGSMDSNICFEVADARQLAGYNSNEYDYLVYLGQFMSCIPEEKYTDCLKEAYRVLKVSGTALFSFMDYDSRYYNPLLDVVLPFLRSVRGEKPYRHRFPYLKNPDCTWNLAFLKKGQPINYWTKRAWVKAELEKAGFTTLEITTGSQRSGKDASVSGYLYVVCKKEE